MDFIVQASIAVKDVDLPLRTVLASAQRLVHRVREARRNGCSRARAGTLLTFEPHAAKKFPLELHSKMILPSPRRSALIWKSFFMTLQVSGPRCT